MAKERRFSLPHEHGGYLTLAGSVAVGALEAPRPSVAIGLGLALAAAFFARGPLEQRAGKRGRFDRALLAALLLLAVIGGLVAAPAGAVAWLAVALPALLVGSSLLARMRRLHRHPLFELSGMGFLGACAGLLAWAGGAPWPTAATAAIACAANAVAAVPLVRSELRPRERTFSARAELAAVALCVVGALVIAALPPVAPSGAALLSRGGRSLALVPRLVAILQRRLAPLTLSPTSVGLRETGILVATVALLVIHA